MAAFFCKVRRFRGRKGARPLCAPESRLDAVFAFHAFSVAQFPVDGIFRILVADDQQMLVDADVHVVEAPQQHPCHSDVTVEFCLVCTNADQQAFPVYLVCQEIFILNHTAKVVRFLEIPKYLELFLRKRDGLADA